MKPRDDAALAARSDSATAAWTCITPIPDEAFPIEVKLNGEAPKWTWIYRDVVGQRLCVECEWIRDGETETRIATWCRSEIGSEAWRLQNLPAPRPLFGLDQLTEGHSASVLVVKGVRTVSFAFKHFPEFCVIGWPRGPEDVTAFDWKPLKDRTVVIWPDNGDAGREAATRIAALLGKAGARSVSVVTMPRGFPAGWSLTDRVPAKADLKALLNAAGPAQAAAPSDPAGFCMTSRGLTWRDPKRDEGAGETFVSGPFEVVAESRDDAGWSWGLLLRWRDFDGCEREWILPRTMLAGDATGICRAFSNGGLRVATEAKCRALLITYLAGIHVNARARIVSETGWHGSAFVFPDGAIGQANGERIILQSTGTLDHAYHVAGDLAGWRERVARFAVGNSRLAVAMSVGLAAALIGPCGAESGGFHLRGPSSIGKSSALAVAGSVWGGGEGGYVRGWRATANALEAVAVRHTDTLLCLDELAQLRAQEAGDVAYMLANGAGKQRLSRGASLRKVPRWHLLFLSSGEIGLAEKIAETARGRRQTAGQHVRVVDVPADTESGYGLFEALHGFADAGDFAQHLVRGARENYGHAARAFVELIASDPEAVRKAVVERVAAFVAENVPPGSDGQVSRVAGRFGLVAAAGEIATAAGILPWPAGEATEAARTCFAAWIEARGGTEAAEVQDGIAAARSFLSAHGASRFLPAWETGADAIQIPNLAGFRRNLNGRVEFFVKTEAWPEVASGLDPKALARNLAQRGFLLTQGKGPHRAKVVRVPGKGVFRVYHLSPSLMESSDT